MIHKNLKRREARGRRAGLTMETLEERYALSCDTYVDSNEAFDSNDRLRIDVSNTRDNEISLHDNGSGNDGNLLVSCDGKVHRFPHDSISEIRVRAYAGDDTVRYFLEGDLSLGRKIDVDLGKGNDTFNAYLLSATGAGSDLLAGAELNLDVRGGSGIDTITVNAIYDVDIHAAARLYMNLGGDEDSDTIRFYYNGELDGTLEFVAAGGDGIDHVGAWLTLDPGSTGTVGNPAGIRPARVDGGAGNDFVDFRIQDDSDGRARIFAELHGGLGNDDFTFTNNVDVIW